MSVRQKGRFWLRCRIYFRRFRLGVWLALLLVLCGFIYLNQVGLPSFVKGPLLERLRARGLDLQFSRLRLSAYGGIVADQVEIGQANETNTVHLTAGEATVQLSPRALANFQLQVDSVRLRNGQLTWPVLDTNGPPLQLTLNKIQTDLRFLPRDEWALDNFRANFAGANIRLSGTVTNASAVRTWKIFQGREPAAPGAMQRQVRAFADAIERTHFSTPPELVVEVRGDAMDLSTFSLLIMLTTTGAETPWGVVTEGRLTARLRPETNQALSRAVITLDAGEARSRWANATNVHLRVNALSGLGRQLVSRANVELLAAAAHTAWASGTGVQVKASFQDLGSESNAVSNSLDLALENAQTRWASAGKSRMSAEWIQSLTNSIPLVGRATGHVATAQSKWANLEGLRFEVGMTHPSTNPPANPDPALAWWTNLQPYALDWKLKADQVSSNALAGRSIELDGSWRQPQVDITNLSVLISTGRLAGVADLDVVSRKASCDLTTTVDPARVEPLLTAGARRWLSQFTWNVTPAAHGRIALVLPAWTNRQPDWRGEVQPTLELNGEFEVPGGGSYRDVAMSSARSHFTYSNMCWNLPDLRVTRPEGKLLGEHRADDRTKAFYWRIQSTLDPCEVGPLLGTNGHRIKEFFTFTEPPILSGEVWGYSRQPGSTALIGLVAATNFTFRGESFSGLQTSVQLTNNILRFLEPRVQRGEQRLSADSVMADFVQEIVGITNGFSTSEVMPVARAIGSKVAQVVEPYRFSTPPTVRVNGVVPMHGQEEADLSFGVEGKEFHWLSFNIPHIVGDIEWKGSNLKLSNVKVELYGGTASGHASFRFKPGEPAEYGFVLITTNTSLKPLMLDVFSTTNHVEGLLNGNLVVTRGTTDDWHTWDGYGSAHLRDGLIWDIPVFGVLSPVLNGIAPGLGNSRANSGTCTFMMTNGVLHSEDVDIRSSGMRLRYRGKVDLHARLNARVEAELLRDMWVVGPLISTVFWPVSKMFEYKVTGTLGTPELEPVYVIPRIMTLPFQPFRLLKGIFPDDSGAGRTNAPPRNGH